MARRQKKTKESSAPITIYDDAGSVLASYPSELVDVIKNTVAKGATDEELYYFLSVAKQHDLNPFMKEIWFVKTEKGQLMIMTSRDGYRKLAMREPTYSKCQSVAVYENDEFSTEMAMGEVINVTHKFKQNDRGKLVGAYAVLKTTDHNNLYCYAELKEYDKRTPIWKQYPSAMLRKVAENDVYKRFVNINGLNDFESMPRKYHNDISDEEMAEMEEISIDDVIDTTISELHESDEGTSEAHCFTDLLRNGGYTEEEMKYVEQAKQKLSEEIKGEDNDGEKS